MTRLAKQILPTAPDPTATDGDYAYANGYYHARNNKPNFPPPHLSQDIQEAWKAGWRSGRVEPGVEM